MSEVVHEWRKDLQTINEKAAESLADPAEYENLFPDFRLVRAFVGLSFLAVTHALCLPPGSSCGEQAEAGSTPPCHALPETQGGDRARYRGGYENGLLSALCVPVLTASSRTEMKSRGITGYEEPLSTAPAKPNGVPAPAPAQAAPAPAAAPKPQPVASPAPVQTQTHAPAPAAASPAPKPVAPTPAPAQVAQTQAPAPSAAPAAAPKPVTPAPAAAPAVVPPVFSQPAAAPAPAPLSPSRSPQLSPVLSPQNSPRAASASTSAVSSPAPAKSPAVASLIDFGEEEDDDLAREIDEQLRDEEGKAD